MFATLPRVTGVTGPCGGRQSVFGFVAKPYRPEDLANKVRAALDKALPADHGSGI
jgi:hypothetical protein